MEKEGLVRAVQLLHSNDLTVGILVTDRHSQITKWVRENLPNTHHYYDVWHLAKGKSYHTFIRHTLFTQMFRLAKEDRKS